MALIRFINLVSELGQCNKFTLPVKNVALKFGIPDWIVDLRHCASHTLTPPLEMLRTGADFALQWLRLYFWEFESMTLEDFTVLPPSSKPESAIHENLLHYQQHLYEILYSQLPYINVKKHQKQVKKIRKSIQQLLRNNSPLFLNILVQPDYLLHTEDQLNYLLLAHEKQFLHNSSIVLPASLFKFWEPLLITLFMKHGNLQAFLEILLSGSSAWNQLNQKIAVAWVTKLISCLDTKEKTRKYSRLQFYQSKLLSQLNWHALLVAGLKSPNKNMTGVLPMILERVSPPISCSNKHHLMALVAIYLGVVTELPDIESSTTNVGMFDFDDLKTIHRKIIEDNSGTESLGGDWSFCADEIDWSSYPLGTCLYYSSKGGVTELELRPTSCVENDIPQQDEDMDYNAVPCQPELFCNASNKHQDLMEEVSEFFPEHPTLQLDDVLQELRVL
ncbi:ribosomal biogenesis protein LAS1L-like [Limulus polyphemus]|uniref:Ribosomal biogenesis protein LAS1L-like n=1 Tax=Limulus polyphemus TaxID=6850 RepID=A0ABM1SU32_LIMPO|nr:ribosomal biogenesis protein LAS1L-like [Limulus polyphemus]